MVLPPSCLFSKQQNEQTIICRNDINNYYLYKWHPIYMQKSSSYSGEIRIQPYHKLFICQEPVKMEIEWKNANQYV